MRITLTRIQRARTRLLRFGLLGLDPFPRVGKGSRIYVGDVEDDMVLVGQIIILNHHKRGLDRETNVLNRDLWSNGNLQNLNMV